MTDLLAPLLFVLDDDVGAFWCFAKLMEFSCISKTEHKQVTLKHQLVSLGKAWSQAQGIDCTKSTRDPFLSIEPSCLPLFPIHCSPALFVSVYQVSVMCVSLVCDH